MMEGRQSSVIHIDASPQFRAKLVRVKHEAPGRDRRVTLRHGSLRVLIGADVFVGQAVHVRCTGAILKGTRPLRGVRWRSYSPTRYQCSFPPGVAAIVKYWINWAGYSCSCPRGSCI